MHRHGEREHLVPHRDAEMACVTIMEADVKCRSTLISYTKKERNFCRRKDKKELEGICPV